MTELQMRLRASSVAYSISTVFMAFLAIQNYRYGLYSLVYTAMLLTPLYFFGALYMFIHQLTPFQDKINLLILSIAAALVLVQFRTHGFAAQQWLYPVGLLSYLVLSIRTANQFNGVLATLAGTLMALYLGLYSAILFFTSYILLCFISGMYAHLHHHRSRSLVALSIHDELTGAYNMRYFQETLDKEASRSRTTYHPLSLIVVEIDYYDTIQKMHSPGTLNQIILQLSAMLNKVIRAGDSHYYQANSRFYLMLPNTPTEGVLVIAERIRRHAEKSQFPEVGSVTVSLGCTTFAPTQENLRAELTSAEIRQELKRQTNTALKESHKNGYNRVSQSVFQLDCNL